MRHALIMAGGAGTRLWPLSRKLRPKQLLKLFDGHSLLQLARQRIASLFSPEATWVITSAAYLDQVAEQLPDVPRANLIAEPVGRDTANAIGLAAHLLARRDSDATMAVFTADHIIEPQERFATAIQAGLDAAERFPESLVTFGIRPQGPHTGYGYLHRGAPVGPGAFQVAEFKEKPTLDVTQAYVQSGEYYWNSGLFVWRASAILSELERLLPENSHALRKLAADWDRVAGTPAALTAFERLPRISIDYGVMERARNVLLIEMDCNWMDLGSWESVAATRKPDRAGNVTIAPRALLIDSHDNIVVSDSDHLLVTLGVNDLVVVHSDDATLVCRKDQVERLKALVQTRQAHFGDHYE
jgi:mannose-1-phosphate guanylyltransferase